MATHAHSDLHLVTYSDGGARGNPGPAGAGFVVKIKNGHTLLKQGIYLGERTNNQAEYVGLYKAIEKSLEFSPASITCYLDSLLAVKQMKGEFKIKEPTLKNLAAQIHSIRGNTPVEFIHVRRELNKEADAMANLAMDKGKQMGDSFVTLRAEV